MPESRIVERRTFHDWNDELKTFVPRVEEVVLWSGSDSPSASDLATAEEAIEEGPGRQLWVAANSDYWSGEGRYGSSEVVVQELRKHKLGRFTLSSGWRDIQPKTEETPEVPDTPEAIVTT